MPACRVYRTAIQNLPSPVTTTLLWDSVRYDNDQMWDRTKPSRLVCRTPGLYKFGVTISFTASAVGIRDITLQHTSPDSSQSGGTIGQALVNAGQASFVTIIQCLVQWPMRQSEYVEVGAFVNDGGISAEVAAAYAPEFWAARIG